MIPSLLTDTVTYDIDRAVHYALLWGLEGLEIRSVGGPNDRVPFVNESKIKLRLLESELPMVAADPDAFIMDAGDQVSRLNDLAQLDESLQFCRRVRCERIVVSSFRGDADAPGAIDEAAEAIRRAGEKARRAGVTVCVLNESGFLAPDGRRMAQLLDAVDDEHVVAAWSPADAVLAGEDPSEGLRRLDGRIGLVRCRNGVIGGNGWEPGAIDSGEIDWRDQLQELHSGGFNGPLCLEVEVEPQAKAGLRDATTLIRLLREIRVGKTR